MKQVYVARNDVDAKLACETLLRAGIRAVVRGDPMPVTTKPFPGVYVVDDADEERALELIDAYREGDGP